MMNSPARRQGTARCHARPRHRADRARGRVRSRRTGWTLPLLVVVLAAAQGGDQRAGQGHRRGGAGAHLPGYDFVAQAVGGLMSITGEPGGSPVWSVSPLSTSLPDCTRRSGYSPRCISGSAPGAARSSGSTCCRACLVRWSIRAPGGAGTAGAARNTARGGRRGAAGRNIEVKQPCLDKAAATGPPQVVAIGVAQEP